MYAILPPTPPVGPINRVVKISEGGTNAESREEALVNLGAVDSRKANQAGGPLTLNAEGKLTIPAAQIRLGNAVAINGPLTAETGVATQYQITNYHAASSYIISTDNGSITRSQDIITFIPGAFTGESGFTVNGKKYSIIVSGRSVIRPSIQTPTNSSTNVSTEITASCSSFSVTSGTDTHQSTTWQLSLDSTFGAIVQQSTDSTVNKLSWTITDLAPSTTYYLRVQHKGTSLQYSAWSNTTVFTTKAIVYADAETSILVDPVPTMDDMLGFASAISGDASTVVLGAHGANLYKGKALIFNQDATGWSFGGTLKNSAELTGDYTGQAVAINSTGSLVVLGGPKVGGKGAAFVFTASGWTQEATLTASDGAAGDRFGEKVAISGDYIVVSAPGVQNNTGVVYIFKLIAGTWTEQTRLKAPDFSEANYFGSDVAINATANTIAIGAKGRNSAFGAVYVYTRTNDAWTIQGTLTATDAAAGDELGSSLAISDDGNTIVAGACRKDASKGAAYLFNRTNAVWTQKLKVTAADGVSGDNFGYSVATSSNASIFYVGAPLKNAGRGVVYVFTDSGTSWEQKDKLLASDTADVPLGSSVSCSDSGGVAVFGTSQRNSNAGAALVFD